jgi:hypothetical protein
MSFSFAPAASGTTTSTPTGGLSFPSSKPSSTPPAAFSFGFGGSTPAAAPAPAPVNALDLLSKTYQAPAFGAFGPGGPGGERVLHEPEEIKYWDLPCAVLYEWKQTENKATVLCKNIKLEALFHPGKCTFRLLGSDANANVYLNHVINIDASTPELLKHVPDNCKHQWPPGSHGVETPEHCLALSAWDFAKTGAAEDTVFLMEFESIKTRDTFAHMHKESGRKCVLLIEELRERLSRKHKEQKSKAEIDHLITSAMQKYKGKENQVLAKLHAARSA